MQPATTTTPTAAADETVLTIRISPRDDRFIARWSTGWIREGGFSGTTVAGIIGTVLDSIWEEGTRRRRRGRPSRRRNMMRRLVSSRVRLVIDIESSSFYSLRTSKQSANIVLVPRQLPPTPTTDSVTEERGGLRCDFPSAP